MTDISEIYFLYIGISALVVILMTVYIAYRFFRLYEMKTRMEIALKEREFFSRYSENRRSTERAVSKLQTEISDTVDEFSSVNHLVIDGQKRISGLSLQPINPDTFLSDLRIDVGNLKIDSRLIFLLTPFDAVSIPFLDAAIEAFRGTDMKVLRGDETKITGEILPHIVQQIVSSRLIIANIEGRNPNVMYELGVAHALGKDVIVVSGVKSFHEEGLPFDLRSRQILLYENREDLIQKLRSDVIKRFFSSRISD